MTLPRIQSLVQRRRVQVLAVVLLVPFLALAPLHLFMPATAKAHGIPAPVQVGISFSPLRAAYLGLDYQTAFKRLEALHFRVIRLSTYWDQVDTKLDGGSEGRERVFRALIRVSAMTPE